MLDSLTGLSFVLFKAGSHVAQVSLRRAVWLRLALNSEGSLPSPLNTGVTVGVQKSG